MQWTLATVAALGAFGSQAGAQCAVSIGSNEGKLLAFYTVPIVFAPATVPENGDEGRVRLGIEVEYIPKPGAEIQRTGACFLRKSEHTSLASIFGRPRVTIGLPWSLAIEASYLPPVKIGDATPDLFSLALSHTRHYGWRALPGGIDVMLRANRTFGKVTGPITCPRASLQLSSSTAPCYGSIPSNDEFRPNVYGADLITAIRPPDGPFAFYGGVGANRIDPHFQVNFTDGAGNVDRTRVQLDRPQTRLAFTAGLTRRAGSRFDIGAQLYSVPRDATTFRIHAGLNFH